MKSLSAAFRPSAGLAGLLLMAQAIASPGSEPVWAGRFDRGMTPWQEVRLKAEIKPNTFTLRDWDGVPALEVKSSASMSLLGRPVEVDLDRTPVLCWRWRIDAPLQSADMTRRSGDDYAARLYVSLALPNLPIRLTAVNLLVSQEEWLIIMKPFIKKVWK